MHKIPKIIHYCWVGSESKPESVEYCIESWKKYCPEYKIIEWNENNYDFTKNRYMKEAYEEKKWGFVPDYARLDIIYNYGGIYLDTDVELVRNLDELLDYDCFLGFEDTGEGEYFISCGLGFGAKQQIDIIKELRDYYDDMSFYKLDGSLNLLPAPKHNFNIFNKNGFKFNNLIQQKNDIIVFPSEYFCPKIFKTDKLDITENTFSIHHFNASWMDEKMLKNIKYQRYVNNKYGKFGRYILIWKSVREKYSIQELFTKLPIRLLNKVKGSIIYAKDQVPYYWNLLIAKCLSKIEERKSKGVVILDTGMFSSNTGDEIIMDNCIYQLPTKLASHIISRISTHRIPSYKEMEVCKKAKIKLLCGTNILSGHMRTYGLWNLPSNILPFHNVVLMGVGFDSKNDKFDFYTKHFFKCILSQKHIHSVRDSFSEQCLKNIGINNVINTACPTMWKLNEQLCSQIPMHKSQNVISTITDYSKDLENDSLMLDILLKEYENVSIWIQGDKDYEYINELGYQDKLNIIPMGLEGYDKFLSENKELDYVGTRLHAGIRAMSYKHRSIIISIDNRAEAISKDTGLPIVYRYNLKDELENKIKSYFETKIDLPKDKINLWLEQFK